ncbi:MAG: DUF2007 domain-containing protein [Verrucomicrobia bacterium]|jgi:hypothetical protein|nr:DUF2007 domain-containing protein [Verrucomicrobiota bacterium]|tara:strand:+ start:18619 stop:18960 length:342 start_codon:yes stop_codon:yes gene_type:complete
MVTVARFYKGEEAYLFRSFLESEGISAHVFDEHVPQIHWLYTNAIGGIRVVVDDEDLDTAADLYKEYWERVATGDAVVGDVKAWPAVLLISIIVGMPFLLFGRRTPLEKSGKP